ncbi:MAG: ferritin family protein [Desulfobacterales bacterium]|jgi:rubrerythrin
MFSITEIIEIAVQLEKNGEQVYRKAIGQSKNPELEDLLLGIAEEELEHIDWLLSLKDDIDKSQDRAQVKEMDPLLIDDLIGKQTFSLADVDFSQVKNSKELIDIFIEFEKDTILFYEMLKTFLVDEKTIDYLEKIIHEESSHIEKLEELRR